MDKTNLSLYCPPKYNTGTQCIGIPFNAYPICCIKYFSSLIFMFFDLAGVLSTISEKMQRSENHYRIYPAIRWGVLSLLNDLNN